jgi:hypothetical protein
MFEWIRTVMKGIPLPWTSPPPVDSGFRRQIAADILDSMSASKLARIICSQVGHLCSDKYQHVITNAFSSG